MNNPRVTDGKSRATCVEHGVFDADRLGSFVKNKAALFVFHNFD